LEIKEAATEAAETACAKIAAIKLNVMLQNGSPIKTQNHQLEGLNLDLKLVAVRKATHARSILIAGIVNT
jgi:predicted MarR family transcription regulator